MPVFYEHISEFAKIAIWKIAEEKNFFLQKVPLQKNITHPQKQLQHLAGRYLLQCLYQDFPYEFIEIAETLKPFLPNEEYHFSISHCGNFAAAIVSKNKRVGIDIEIITPKVERVKHKFLNEAESLKIQNSEFRIQKLTLLWCCKEAVFKWYGNGGVDFKEDINLHFSDLTKKEGIIQCEFLKVKSIALKINYKFFDEMCLAWVVD